LPRAFSNLMVHGAVNNLRYTGAYFFPESQGYFLCKIA
jgi:hypothetical protein